jgi:hypothetical protein
VFRAYFDGSGTNDASDAVAWGGLIGSDAQWDALVPRWREELKRPRPPHFNGVGYYNRYECENGHGAFLGWNRAACDSITYDLRQTILDSGMAGFVAGTFKSAWEQVPKVALHVMGGAEAFCFSECIGGHGSGRVLTPKVGKLPYFSKTTHWKTPSARFDRGRTSSTAVWPPRMRGHLKDLIGKGRIGGGVADAEIVRGMLTQLSLGVRPDLANLEP